MIDIKLCPYGLWGGNEPCNNRMQCITSGEPKCMQSLGSGETVKEYLIQRRLWKNENQK